MHVLKDTIFIQSWNFKTSLSSHGLFNAPISLSLMCGYRLQCLSDTSGVSGYQSNAMSFKNTYMLNMINQYEVRSFVNISFIFSMMAI